MNIDLSTVRGIIRRSLQEDRAQGTPADLRTTRAVYRALKTMYLLCKDQPLSRPVDVRGAPEGSDLGKAAAMLMQPEYAEVVRALPEMVLQEASALLQ